MISFQFPVSPTSIRSVLLLNLTGSVFLALPLFSFRTHAYFLKACITLFYTLCSLLERTFSTLFGLFPSKWKYLRGMHSAWPCCKMGEVCCCISLIFTRLVSIPHNSYTSEQFTQSTRAEEVLQGPQEEDQELNVLSLNENTPYAEIIAYKNVFLPLHICKAIV